MADISAFTVPGINPTTAVAAGIRPAEGMKLSDIMSLASNAQTLHQAKQLNPLQLEKAQIELNQIRETSPLTIRQQAAATKLAEETLNPKIEAEKAKSEKEVKTVQSIIEKAKSEAATAATGSESAAFKFANEQTNAIAGRLTSHINDPFVIAAERNPKGINAEELGKLVSKYGKEQADALGISKEKAEQLIAPYIVEATTNPAGYRQFLKSKLLATVDAPARISAMQPTGISVATGAGGGTVQTGEFGQHPQGTIIPGTGYFNQLPPTTLVANPQGGTNYLGAPTQSGQPTTPVPAALPPQQAAILLAGGNVVAEDWKDTSAKGAAAANNIGTLQNIKKYATDAFTGVGGARKSLAAGIANSIGMSVYEAEKTATDVLAKNANLLALTGGNTDAARALAEASNPNAKMNLDAIRIATDQLIGLEKLKTAKYNFLAPVKDDAIQYQQKLQQFNSVADPRIFQEMTPAEVKKLKSSMSAAAQKELGDKIRLAKQLGIIQ